MIKEFEIKEPREFNKQERDIFSELEKDKITAPGIVEIEIPNLESLAKKYSTEVGELENIFIKNFESWVKEISPSSVSAKKMEIVETMFYLFNIANSDKEKPDWVKSFTSWDLFIQKYGQNISREQKEAIRKQIDWFVDRIAQPQMILRGDPESKDPYRFRLETYYTGNNFVLMPEEERSGIYEYVEKRVIKEVIKLLEEGHGQPDYTHTTGSSALEAIGKDGAILSSKSSINSGKQLKTGERSALRSETEGLGSVYVDKGNPKYGYHVLNWFNEYAVTFGINKNSHEKDQDTNDTKYPDGRYFVDLGSEGTIIGPRVSLNSIYTVFCWKRYEEKIKKFIQKNVPQAKFISLEAIEVLNKYGNLFKDYAVKNGKTEKEVWEKLLN